MTDVLLFHTPDGGEITAENGLIAMDDGLGTAVYLSLFGGNERDGGDEATDSLQWWGNLGELDAAKQYRSATQHLLRALPAVPRNLKRLEDAMARDLAWMTEGGIASAITARARLTGRNRVDLDIRVEIDGVAHPFTFTADWQQAQ